MRIVQHINENCMQLCACVYRRYVPKSLGASTFLLLLLLLLLLRYTFLAASLATAETNGTVLRTLSSARYIFLALTHRQEAECVHVYCGHDIYGRSTQHRRKLNSERLEGNQNA